MLTCASVSCPRTDTPHPSMYAIARLPYRVCVSLMNHKHDISCVVLINLLTIHERSTFGRFVLVMLNKCTFFLIPSNFRYRVLA